MALNTNTAAPQRPDGTPSWTLTQALTSVKPLLIPALIFVLALAPRLAWVTGSFQEARYERIYNASLSDFALSRPDDATFYLLTARSLAQGDGYAEPFFGTPTARYPPGWPAVLSVFYFIFGPNVLPALIFNAVVGAATAVLTFLLGSRLFSRKIGLGAGIIMALFPGHILFSSWLLTEVLFTFMLALTLLFACGGVQGWRALVLGLMTGAATLVRGEAVLLPILFLVVLLLRGAPWRSTVRHITLVGVGMAILLLPWAVRNSVQFDSPVFLTTSTGAQFMLGHASTATGTYDFAAFQSLWERHEDLPEPRRQLERDATALREAWDGFRSDPLGDLALIPAKLRWLYGHDPARRYGEAVYQPVWVGPLPFQQALILADSYYYLVLAGALLMLALRYAANRRGAYGLLFGTIALWSFIFGFLFYGDARYHMSLLPLFSIAAAGGIAALCSRAGWPSGRLLPLRNGDRGIDGGI